MPYSLFIICVDRVKPERISFLTKLASRVSEERFDLGTHKNYVALRIGFPHHLGDGRHQ
jgi:hypothetical protein